MSDPTAMLIYEQLYRPTEPNDPLPDPGTNSTTRRLWATAERIRDALTAAGWRDVHDLEEPGSILCDCDPTPEHQPTNPTTGAEMDHHCDCTAVETVAQLLGETATVHHRQCVCKRPMGGTDG